MKANEAPEKIYFTQTENGTHYYTEGVPSRRNHIEYTRKDAFIEKACKWIKYYNENGGCLFDGWEDDFKNYMKGK